MFRTRPDGKTPSLARPELSVGGLPSIENAYHASKAASDSSCGEATGGPRQVNLQAAARAEAAWLEGRQEDVVGETWLGVLRGIDGFQGRSSLRTWIFRIVINTAKTRAQREGRYAPWWQQISIIVHGWNGSATAKLNGKAAYAGARALSVPIS
jgi:hypothetical protein